MKAILIALALALAIAPATAPAQRVTKLKFQSVFPQATLFFENSKYFTERVRALTGGRLQIEMLAPGAVVPPFEVLDAVHKGILDGAHSSPAYWVGKNRAATLFGPAPGGPFGMDMLDYMGWVHEGGGLALFQEFYQKVLKRNVVAMPMTSGGPQILGWFSRPVKNWNDLKNRKCRETGITAEVFSKSGMKTVNMPGGEIVPAGERGVIECAEWAGPMEDMRIGFQSVWKFAYMPSVHEPASMAELLINAAVWKKLPDDQKEAINSAAMEATLRSQLVLNKLNAKAIDELSKKHGVTIARTPPEILTKTLQSWDQIASEESSKNAFFKKVYDSQRNYAAQVVPARQRIYPDYDLSAAHYWPEKK